MSKNKDFTPTELSENFEFFKKLDLYTFYEELEKLFKLAKDNDVCNQTISLSGIEDPEILSFLKKICMVLKHLINHRESSIHDIKSKDKHCIYLKYWLYHKLIIRGFDEYDINIIFDFLEKHKNGCMKLASSDKPCNFYKLTWKDIYQIRNVYNYSELLYDGDMKIYDDISKEEKYINYFKNGLTLYRSSKTICPTKRQNEYCYEFNEYEKVHSKYKNVLPFFSCREKLLSSLHKEDATLTGELSRDEEPNNTMDPDLYTLLNELVDKGQLKKFYEFLEQHKEIYIPDSCNFPSNYPVKGKNAFCKLLGQVKNILENWDGISQTHNGLKLNESCDYLNYWLYNKFKQINATPCDIEVFYILWHKFALEKTNNNKKTCYNKEYYGFSKKELVNKKRMFEFLEYYKFIKEKLNESKDEKKNVYCSYIKGIFELYKNMETKKYYHSYGEELKLFQNVFSSNGELHFLEEKCPDMCLGFVFNNKFKTLCPFEDKSIPETEKINLKPCEKMDHSISRRDIDENRGKDYNFSDLITSAVYNELNGEVTIDKYYSVCSALIPYNKEHCGIYNLCSKLVKNLIKLSNMKKQDRNNRCEYITHWTYNEIMNIPNIFANNYVYGDVLRVFFNVVYEVLSKLDIFNCYFNTSNIDFNEQKEKRYLHDYFKNYEKMNSEKFCNNEQCKEYCDYILFINEIYGKHINKCCYCFTSNGCKELYPSYFKCDDNYNPHKLFEKLQCNNFEEFRAKLKKVDTPIPEDHYVKRLAYISVNEPHLLNWGNKKSSIIPEVVSDKITSDPFYTFALGSLGFLGVLLILFILYKFTPMGSYFNNRDERNKESYFEHFEQQFLEDEVQFKHGNTQNRRMSIAYHQA
ncbi:PIR Superfamily Protein [Plasmodium ovale curtisi]|uniref:PIR Superfamily Protein n=1 Tax=Plasmodium ovale curtisi TaxID=864141 RepID=A0A1A8WUD4_PLAOA|nr:PIR Superfamily Protein [Plasmodium ovale curtisi]SBT02130.1 PIR Superfamily Protein [Plasmodium ovale curtisi]